MNTECVIFHQKNSLACGYIDLSNSKIKVNYFLTSEPSNNEVQEISASRFVYRWTEVIESNADKLEFLKTKYIPKKDFSYSLLRYWQKNLDSLTNPVPLVDLVHFCCENYDLAPHIVMTLESTMATYFKRNVHGHYELIDKYIVTQRQWKITTKKWLSVAMENTVVPWDHEYQPLVEQLRCVLINQQNSKHWSDITSILFQINNRENAKNIEDYWSGTVLRCYNALAPNKKLSWPEIYKLRAKLVSKPTQLCGEGGKDVVDMPVKFRISRGTFTFTIDSAQTRDFDDAVTILHVDNGGIAISVHIANIASLMLMKTTDFKEDPLFKEAEKNITSVYIPEISGQTVFPMLPTEISEGKYSLVEGKLRQCISYDFYITKTGDCQFVGIYPEYIRIDRNLSYEDAEVLINDDNAEPFWQTLSQCCQALQNKRFENGAIDFGQSEDLDITISVEDVVEIKVTSRESFKSANIISELSVLVNSKIGEFFAKNGVPALYKSHPPFTLKTGAPKPPKISDVIFQNGPGSITTIPSPNSVIGVNYYSQQTSPLRRFYDLLLQLQLVYFIGTNCILLSEYELKNYAKKIQEVVGEKSQIEKNIIKHWVIKYLKQNLEKGEDVCNCISKRYDGNTGLHHVALTDLGNVILQVKVDTKNPSERFKVAQLLSVDHYTHHVTIKPIL